MIGQQQTTTKKERLKTKTQKRKAGGTRTVGAPRRRRKTTVKTSRLYPTLTSLEGILSLTQDQCQDDPFLIRYLNLQTCLTQLNEIIGNSQAKQTVVELVNYFMIHRQMSPHQRLHSVIQGGPGTGKTMFASILAKIYCTLGILKTNRVHQVSAKDLIGEYIGQTNQRTQRAIEEAIGGVLLIDEVYSIGAGERVDSNGFGVQCINTLNQALTERGHEFVVVIAGYEKEIEKHFFSFNPGLRRRFPITFSMNSFHIKSSIAFLISKLNKNGFRLLGDPYAEIVQMQEELTGGDLEVILLKADMIMTHRLYKTSSCCEIQAARTMTCEDINTAFKQWKTSLSKKENCSSLVSHLYT